jgi:hypothetical protein
MSSCDVAIVGAGPYGLAAAAHLRSSADGLETRVFGDVMAFWRDHMPLGMLLRSPRVASHIADPERALTLDAYEATIGAQASSPVPLSVFVEYGAWFQRQVAPDLDSRRVLRAEATHRGFRLLLEDEAATTARHLVVAAGIAPFARRPPQFRELPDSVVSHAVDIRDVSRFEGRNVVVIGGGQSALESAALLNEAGARVEVVARTSYIHWLDRSAWLHSLGPLSKILYAPTDVGPAGLSWLVATPGWFRRAPRSMQERLARRSTRPAGAAWLKPRLAGVVLTTGRSVVSAALSNGTVVLSLDGGVKRNVDHIVLGTGYQVDVARYEFLEPLTRSLRCVHGYPVLDVGFESSVPRLHFLGASAAYSFGPLMRFVAGTEFAGRALSRAILRRRRKLPRRRESRKTRTGFPDLSSPQ